MLPQITEGSCKIWSKDKGDHKYKQHGNSLVSLWQDTKTVSVLSTNQSPLQVTVSRRQKDGTHVDVPCPLAIKMYNVFIGGVDKHDQLCGYYSVRTKSRKSYKYLFWFLFDVAIVNSFILYGLSPTTGRKTMKEFRVELAHQLIGSYNSNKYRGRPQANQTSRPRRMQVPHYPIKSSRRRCQMCSKEGQRVTTSWWCNECQLRLCHTGDSTTDCFLKHHLSKGLYTLLHMHVPLVLSHLTLTIIISSCLTLAILILPCHTLCTASCSYSNKCPPNVCVFGEP